MIINRIHWIYCLSLALVLMPRCGFSQEAIRQIEKILASCNSVEVDCSVGRVDFEIIRHEQNGYRRYQGTASWEHPNIRIESAATDVDTKHKYPIRQIILENPKEIVAHNLTSRAVFRSPDKSFTYPSALRIAPWQSWFEVLGQIRLTRLLDPNRDGKTRTVKHTPGFIHDTLAIGPGNLTVTYDKTSFLPLEYKFSETDGPSGHGTYGWSKLPDGTTVLKEMAYTSWSGGQSKPSKPTWQLELSGYKSELSDTEAEFTFDSLDLSDVLSTSILRAGAKPIVKKTKVGKAQQYRELGAAMREFGFSKKQD